MLKIELTDYPAVNDYLSRLSARPAFIKTILKR